MVSIVASFGDPDWKKVKLPVGRSKMACMHQYYAAIKEAQMIALGDSQNADAVKKRGPKDASSAKNSPSKGKRGHKEQNVHESDVSDNEGPMVKKVKNEGSDDEKAAKYVVQEV